MLKKAERNSRTLYHLINFYAISKFQKLHSAVVCSLTHFIHRHVVLTRGENRCLTIQIADNDDSYDESVGGDISVAFVVMK